MLHTVAHSPYHFDFSLFLKMIKVGDVIVLLQDGVSAAVKGSQMYLMLQQCQVPIYALTTDVEARGLMAQLAREIQIINHQQFVELTVNYFPQLAW